MYLQRTALTLTLTLTLTHLNLTPRPSPSSSPSDLQPNPHPVLRFRGIATENAAGVVQQMHNHDFERPPNVVSDRRKCKSTSAEAAPASGGFFHRGLTLEL